MIQLASFSYFFSSPFVPIIIAFLAIIYFFILTFFVFKTFLFVRILFGKGKKDDLRSILTDQLGKIAEVKTKTSEMEKRVLALESLAPLNIQKVGVVRFNPFDDTGGDQSFVIAFLDGENNGIVISSMHGRDRTRIYCKPVRAGKESDYPLSTEEKEAIKKAQNV